MTPCNALQKEGILESAAASRVANHLGRIIAGALLALHIGNGGPLNGTAAFETASPPSQGRPTGWSPATHGNQARPDYAGLFALDSVHELRISIDAATFRAMREDLMSVLPFGAIPTWPRRSSRGTLGRCLWRTVRERRRAHVPRSLLLSSDGQA